MVRPFCLCEVMMITDSKLSSLKHSSGVRSDIYRRFSSWSLSFEDRAFSLCRHAGSSSRRIEWNIFLADETKSFLNQYFMSCYFCLRYLRQNNISALRQGPASSCQGSFCSTDRLAGHYPSHTEYCSWQG